MDSRSRISLGRLLLVCVLALVAAGSVLAEPDYKKLKKEIPELEKAVRLARDERDAADQKVANNRAAQKRAEGAALATLKKKAKELTRKAGEKADLLAEAQQKLGNQQGELRAAAAKYAVSQINASGNLAVRVAEALTALDDWDDAVKGLPDVPKLRSVEGITDPLAQKAVRAEDKKQLKAYDDWAAAEEKRLETEIKQADELIGAKEKVKSADDGDLLVTNAQSLKKKLQTRKESVQKLRKKAKETLDSID